MYWLQPSTIPRGIVKAGKACLLAMAPVEWITNFPAVDPATQMLTGDITLSGSHQWLRALLVSNNSPLQSEDNFSPAGLTRQITISGKTVGHSIPIHHYLNNYPHHRWVVLYQEAGTGITYAIGRPGSAMRMSTSYNNESNTINTLTLNLTALHRPPVYRGTFTLDNNVSVDTGATLGVAFYNVPLDVSIDPPTISFSPATNLRGKTILWVSRSGMKDMMPVSGAPANDVEIQFESTTNTFTLHPDWPLAPGESFAILYK